MAKTAVLDIQGMPLQLTDFESMHVGLLLLLHLDKVGRCKEEEEVERKPP
jgi:hypothetical protein